MKLIEPKLKSTEHSPDFREWIPASLDDLLIELDHVVTSCETDKWALFRGQTNYEWPLDSTFVRNSIQSIFGIPDYQKLKPKIRRTVSFHRSITSLLLLKFGTVWKPSEEAFEREKIDDIDPWYELMKNLQQYPERDKFIKGTFLIDWSSLKDIGLYFATFQGKGDKRSISYNHGALWICDANATGNTLQIKKLGEILKLMRGEEFLNGNKTFPLIFHPPRQSLQPRSINQVPVYISQMDFRCDLADIWTGYENDNKKRVFIKLIIPENIKRTVANYLESKGISEDMVYPK